MFKSFIKIALRNFLKERFFSAINIAGLSVGIAVALLISLFLIHELSFDRFHSKHDRIHRLGMYLEANGSGSDLNSTFPPMAEAIQREIPEIDQAIRAIIYHGRIFKFEDKVFTEDKILYTDSAFFSVFDFKLISGNPALALARSQDVILTTSLVKKYFGTDDYASVVGKTILINQAAFDITGVVEPAPANSHLQFNAIAALESIWPGRDKTWDNLNVTTYVLLQPGTTMDAVMEKIPTVLRKYLPNYDQLQKQNVVMRPITIPLTDIHLKSQIRGEFEPGGSMMNIYIFGSVGLVVLLLASVNFVNLLTARSANRAKEVGVRKVLGSSRKLLIRQFIFECILLVMLSTLLALGTVELLRGPFTILIGKDLPFDTLISWTYLSFLFGFVLALGMLAGSYPAFFLSSFQPAQVLKGKLRSGFKTGRLRNGLVTLQFTISMVLISCTLIMSRQLEFMRAKKLGFEKDNVLIIDNANRLKSQQAFIEEVVGQSGVESAGSASFRPIDDYDGILVELEGGKDNRKPANFSQVDENYLRVLKYDFIEGRNFSRDIASDSSAVVINERAAQMLFGGRALGQKMVHGRELTVIGVVKDFNFESLKNEIRPLIFFYHPNQRFLHVRITPGNYQRTIEEMEKLWKQHTSDVPFRYAFLDDSYDDLFKEEVKLGSIFSLFTALGLFIACLGLMGVAAYSAEQRKKEISIRKVLGASVGQVMRLLSSEFVRMMVISFIVAVPISWYVMSEWLSSFIYRTDVPIGVLLVGGVIVTTVALMAISYQSIRAALVDPVESLKEE